MIIFFKLFFKALMLATRFNIRLSDFFSACASFWITL